MIDPAKHSMPTCFIATAHLHRASILVLATLHPGQHSDCASDTTELAEAAGEDVRTLARLYQLQNKMDAVGQVRRSPALDALIDV